MLIPYSSFNTSSANYSVPTFSRGYLSDFSQHRFSAHLACGVFNGSAAKKPDQYDSEYAFREILDCIYLDAFYFCPGTFDNLFFALGGNLHSNALRIFNSFKFAFRGTLFLKAGHLSSEIVMKNSLKRSNISQSACLLTVSKRIT